MMIGVAKQLNVQLRQTDYSLMLMIGATLVMPLIIGLYLQNHAEWRFVSIPLHSTMETAGAIIAFVLSAIIFILYHRSQEINHFHRASFALIAMGIFDLFHAMMPPGELFVWLHSLAIFIGGVFFSFVWFADASQVSKRVYYALPLSIFLISFIISIASIANPEILPKMLEENKEFTQAANLLNIIGGVMYVVASFYFIKKYIETEEIDNLLFAGHTLLFASAGLLFFFSSLWDMSWWFWHTLRLLAYVISLYFMMRIFYRTLTELAQSNHFISDNNQRLQQSNKLLEEYKNAIYEGGIVSTGDLEGKITYVNNELLELTGYTRSELIGQPHNIFRDPETPKSVFKDMWHTIQNKQTFKGLIKNRKKNGDSFYVKITITPIIDNTGQIFTYVALREDVTELVNSQNELKSYFYTDHLTRLYNRFKLKEDLKNNHSPHLALINIDNFKSINDFYGIEFGDQIIQALGDKMLDMLHSDAYFIYRNHGDEFAVLASSDVHYPMFEAVIQNMIDTIEQSQFKINDVLTSIQLSIGLVESSNDIIKADIALKEAKQTHRSLVKYSDGLKVEKIFQNNILWTRRIKAALKEDRIEVVFQPILNNATNKITKYETLARMVSKEGEVIPPFEFLKVAKRTRLYSQITRRVFQKALQALSHLEGQITINISSEDIFDDTTQNYIFNLLHESDNAHRVVLELVESEGIESFSQVKAFINEVKLLGVQIAIDDFGTGYSNFEYLIKLQADIIKIDGSLIKNIDINENRYNIIETIVSFAKKNRMKVVAEFVSSQQIQQKVMALNIEYSQGYFIDRPKFLKELGH